MNECIGSYILSTQIGLWYGVDVSRSILIKTVFLIQALYRTSTRTDFWCGGEANASASACTMHEQSPLPRVH